MRTMHLRGTYVLVFGVLALACVSLTLPNGLHSMRTPSTLPMGADRPELPVALVPRVNASFAADDPAYAISALSDDAATLRAANPANRLTTTFAPDGIAFAGQGDAQWGLRLSAVGTDEASRVVAPIIAGNRVEYHRGDLTEWYVNGPLGVEQGFTLAAPPSSGNALTLTLGVAEGATLRPDNGDVTLTLPTGETLRYGHLLVTGATGRQLPARLDVLGDAITITADLAGAVYPVTVDPLVQLKTLTASDGTANDTFGASVSMSANGTRVIVGAFGKTIGANANQGAAYVYSGTNYATEQRLTASDGAASDFFGASVAMSADGTRVIVSASGKTIGANASQGAAYVYSGANYATEKKLTASDGIANDLFGKLAAMSADGTRVIVGARTKKIGANASQGAAYVYSGINYGIEKKLTASDGAANDFFGISVAISADGTRVIVGADNKKIGANATQGAAYVYSGVNYATEKKLIASDGAAGDTFGISVAMNTDGTTVIVGAYFKTISGNVQQGAAYVYSGTNYATEKRLTASDGAANDFFGRSVAMSSDGTIVIIGASGKKIGANVNQGAAYLDSGTNYATETKLTASDGAGGDFFGDSVAMSVDGRNVIVGADSKKIGANAVQGAAYLFGDVTPPNLLPTTKPTGPLSGPPASLPTPKTGGVSGGVPNPLPQARP